MSDYSQMDRILREERQYILDICKKIKKAGCNVLLIQKSILRYNTAMLRYFHSVCLCRDAVNDLALHFLAKMKIMVVRDIEREDIEFISRVRRSLLVSTFPDIISGLAQTLGCRPVASLDHFLPEHLGAAQLVEEVSMDSGSIVKVSYMHHSMIVSLCSVHRSCYQC